jgi:hypothetical protein
VQLRSRTDALPDAQTREGAAAAQLLLLLLLLPLLLQPRLHLCNVMEVVETQAVCHPKP